MNLRRSVPAVPDVRVSRGARAAALAGLAAVTLSGCGMLSSGAVDTPAAAAKPPATTAAPSPSPDGATSGLGSVKDQGDLPDPCTLLSRDEVTDLTGREITQIDEDDADPAATTRFCQWQQDGGQLALFLSRTTEADFRTQIADAKPVDGVGEDAFLQAGHLYVLYGTVQIDVYSRGAQTEDENLTDAVDVANAVIPQI